MCLVSHDVLLLLGYRARGEGNRYQVVRTQGQRMRQAVMQLRGGAVIGDGNWGIIGINALTFYR